MRTTTMDDVDAMIPIMTNPETMLFTLVAIVLTTQGSALTRNGCRRGVVNVTSRSVAEAWLKMRCMGKDVLSFMVTLKPAEAKARGLDDGREHVIGILGGHHPPEIGYILHIGILPPRAFAASLTWRLLPVDHAGHGYATEALRALIPFYFSLVPSAAETGRPECDYMEGRTDFENFASQKVLTKCGFVIVEGERETFDNAVLGVREILCYRLARPGTKLAMREDEEEPPKPPVE